MAQLVITDQDVRRIITIGGTPTQGPHSFDFFYFDDDDIDVYVDGALQTKTTHYSISPSTTHDDGFAGGTVTTVASLSNATVAIVMALPFSKASNMPTSGPFDVATLNTQISKLISMLQVTREWQSRALIAPVNEEPSFTLPSAALRADSTLTFDSSGNATVISGTLAPEVTASTFGASLVDDADAAAARTTLGIAGVSGASNVAIAGKLTVAGDTASGDDAAIGFTSAEGLILTGQGSSADLTIKNDADATVLSIATGTTNVDVGGDITGATINADADTSAGDKAAMGFTTAEGLILTGQGTSSDITVKNDADAAVLSVATGTTTVEFKGGVTFKGEGTNTTDAVQGVAKAWSHINGSGTPAHVDSLNMASLTDEGTGDYSAVIASDFASVSYAMSGSSFTGGAYTNAVVGRAYAAGSCRFITSNANSAFDSDDLSIVIHGDLS